AEAEGEAQRGRPLGLGPVADADDLQLLAEAGRDADDHVVDEAAGQPVEAAALPLVVGPLDHERALVLTDGDGAGDGPGERAARALHRDGAPGNRDVHPARDGDGGLANAAHWCLLVSSAGS